MDDLRLAMLGFGNAGQAFAKMLCEKQNDIKGKYSRGVIVTAISTKTKGNIINSEGIDLAKACSDVETLGRFGDDTPGLCDATDFDVIENADYDVMCELTPLNIMTGQPAIDHIKKSFAHGSHVVTANKGPIAWAYSELKEMAENAGRMFFYETTVMDGTPVFNLVDHDLQLCRVTEISGILNTTTNYILEEMAAGKDYDAIIAEGRRRGFIEADAAMDIEGYDAAAKVTALLNALMDAKITPDMVERKGIEILPLTTLKRLKIAEK